MKTVTVISACLLPLAVAACNAESSAPTPSPSSTIVTTPTGPRTLTKADFAAGVNTAIQREQTFRVRTNALDAKATPIVAQIRLVGEYTNMRVTTGELELIKFSHNYTHHLYAADPKLTGNPAKPWVKIDPDSDNLRMLFLAEIADLVVSYATPHLLANGAPYATTFAAGKTENVGGVATTAYRMTVDLNKATDLNAFDDYIDAEDAASLPKTLDVTVWIDSENLPRKITFPFKDRKIVATFDRFGENLLVKPPPANKIGTVKES